MSFNIKKFEIDLWKRALEEHRTTEETLNLAISQAGKTGVQGVTVELDLGAIFSRELQEVQEKIKRIEDKVNSLKFSDCEQVPVVALNRG